ncbi:MAG TPA: hypothetical protein VLA74_04575 [Nitrososphaeraceae archaeon]|jgi:hypothetical protein|nr:hypothetical protein [Nitrososphaeraceae archaeon]
MVVTAVVVIAAIVTSIGSVYASFDLDLLEEYDPKLNNVVFDI